MMNSAIHINTVRAAPRAAPRVAPHNVSRLSPRTCTPLSLIVAVTLACMATMLIALGAVLGIGAPRLAVAQNHGGTSLVTPTAPAGTTVPQHRTWCVSLDVRRGCTRTINEATKRAASGDAIVIAAGTYTEPVVLDRPVILVGGYNKSFSEARSNDTVLAGGLTVKRASAIYNLTVKGSIIVTQVSGWRSLLYQIRIIGDGSDICVALSDTAQAIVRRSFLSHCQTAFAGGQFIVRDTTIDNVATAVASSRAVVRDSILSRVGVHLYLQSTITATNNVYRDVPAEQSGAVPVNFGSTVREVSAEQLDTSLDGDGWMLAQSNTDPELAGAHVRQSGGSAKPGDLTWVFGEGEIAQSAPDALMAEANQLSAPVADAHTSAVIVIATAQPVAAPTAVPQPQPADTTTGSGVMANIEHALSVLMRGPLGLPQAVVSLAPIYGLIALLVMAIVFSNARISTAVHMLRHAHLREAETANAALLANRRSALATTLEEHNGWVPIAAQLIANAIGETLTIDIRSGILDVASRPSPRFTVLADDGRRFTFTVSLRGLKENEGSRLSGLRGIRTIDLGAADLSDAMDTQTLWEHFSSQGPVGAGRTLPRTAVPRRFTWHLVIVPARGSSVLKLKLYAALARVTRFIRTAQRLMSATRRPAQPATVPSVPTAQPTLGDTAKERAS